MDKKRRNSNKSDFQLEFDDGGKMSRRETKFLPDGAYFFEDELKIEGEFSAKVITCAAWLLELYELKSGGIFFTRGAEKIRPNTKHFAVFYAPFSISQANFKNVKGNLRGIAASDDLPAEFARVPAIFETPRIASLSGLNNVLEILQAGRNRQSIEMNPKPSLLSLKTKKLIDENYQIYPSIARIAARLKVSHEHLSRQFRHDFEMSPSAYFRQLRIADVPLRLAKGEEIITVSHDVGYNDLSRFYKQFRKTTKTSPGACQTMMKPKI